MMIKKRVKLTKTPRRRTNEIIVNIETILENDREIMKSLENDHDRDHEITIAEDLDPVIVANDQDLAIVTVDHDQDRKIVIVIEDPDRVIAITPALDRHVTVEITATVTTIVVVVDPEVDPVHDLHETNSVVHDPRSTKQNCWQLPRRTPSNF